MCEGDFGGAAFHLEAEGTLSIPTAPRKQQHEEVTAEAPKDAKKILDEIK